jgi:endonuclease/exonuclease/phosphatase family metal-dependent hydrolase
LALALLIVPLSANAATESTEGGGGHHRVGPIRTVTYNLYVGADIFRVAKAALEDPNTVPWVVADVVGTMIDTNFTERSVAIADQIAKSRPHVIGLQEVSLIRHQSPGDFLIGNPTPAELVLYDYLDILMDALAARGLHYRVAGVVEDADVELPMFAGVDSGGNFLFDDIRLTDHDVILVQKGVETSNVVAQNYSLNLEIPIAGTDVVFLRGFVALDAKVKGREYRFVNTHLEVGPTDLIPNYQSAQALELATILAAETKPVILVGDFNSKPEDPPTQPYWILTGAGYVDTWLRKVGRPWPGYTCCQDETVDNWKSLLDERIDLIFVRNETDFPAFPDLGPVRARVLGNRPWDKTPSGLWPSDHAGVYAKLIIPFG